MNFTDCKWSYEMHLPRHSADGFYQVFEIDPVTEQRGQIIAYVDPNDDFGGDTEQTAPIAALFAAAPKLHSALMVMVTTPGILAYLRANDPKALEQATAALQACVPDIGEDD